MSKKNVIVLIIIILLVLIVILGGFMYIYKVKPVNNDNASLPKTLEELKKQQDAVIQATYNKEFPDLITGIINIVSDTQTTIKLDNGTVYAVMPVRPMSYFKDSGIKNKSAVKARGKILSPTTFTIGSIIPGE